jgi:hypothetical protein
LLKNYLNSVNKLPTTDIIIKGRRLVMADKKEKKPKTNVSAFGFLVKELNNMDIQDEYEFLKTKLKLGSKRLDVDTLSEAIDDSPELSFTASRLSSLAKEKFTKFEDMTFRLRFAELSEEAIEILEEQKRQKKFSGQVTKEKIENWIILNKPEYLDLLQEYRELKAAVEVFGSLAIQFESKKSLLQTQGRLLERKK